VTASGFTDKKIKVGKESFYRIDIVYNDNVRNSMMQSVTVMFSRSTQNAIMEKESKNMKDYSNYKSIYELIASEIYEVRVDGSVILNRK